MEGLLRTGLRAPVTLLPDPRELREGDRLDLPMPCWPLRMLLDLLTRIRLPEASPRLLFPLRDGNFFGVVGKDVLERDRADNPEDAFRRLREEDEGLLVTEADTFRLLL